MSLWFFNTRRKAEDDKNKALARPAVDEQTLHVAIRAQGRGPELD